VTGYSNIAVNNIMAGLLKHGVKALRVGHGHGMDSDTLQSESEKDRRFEDVRRMREQFRGAEAGKLLFLIQDKVRSRRFPATARASVSVCGFTSRGAGPLPVGANLELGDEGVVAKPLG
jgi:hypothetical protein